MTSPPAPPVVETLLLGEFPRVTDEEREARRLWLGYYAATEKFDRTLDGHWSDEKRDEWMPFNRTASTRFARGKLDELHALAHHARIPADVVEAERRSAMRIRHDDALAELRAIAQAEGT